jgi:hypothetical protein
MDQWRHLRKNWKGVWTKWKLKYNLLKFVGCMKAVLRGKFIAYIRIEERSKINNLSS